MLQRKIVTFVVVSIATFLMGSLGGPGTARADHVAAYSSYNGPYYDPNFARGIYGVAGGDIVFPVICQPYPYCSGGNPYGRNAFAFQFTALHSGVLEAVWLTLWNRDNWVGSEGGVRISLLADANDDPGSALGSWDLDVTRPAPYSYEILNGDDALVLTQDFAYWLQVEPLSDLSAVAWYGGYDNDGYGVQITSLQGTLYAGASMPAMAVYLTVPVPEPATASAGIAALATLGVGRVIRRR